ncbi:MAG: carbohydrate ABC transporter permease, partial [Acholeplasmataceae bacterium]|nr:carbohydrate ABC transporter permease [Acholeplasmataceae bacterium]
ANPLQKMYKVVLPLIRPSAIAVGIFFFINSWNEYFWPLLILQDKNMYTLPLALQMFISAEGGSEWGIAMAVAMLTSLLPLILYFISQRFILNTFMQSGVKG